MTPEMEALKTKLKSTWMAGDFGQIARGYAPGAQEFVARLNLIERRGPRSSRAPVPARGGWFRSSSA